MPFVYDFPPRTSLGTANLNVVDLLYYLIQHNITGMVKVGWSYAESVNIYDMEGNFVFTMVGGTLLITNTVLSPWSQSSSLYIDETGNAYALTMTIGDTTAAITGYIKKLN